MDRFSLIVGLIGISSFILAIPLAVAANLLTPRVREWWGNSSKARSVARLEKLDVELALLDSLNDSDALAEFLRRAMLVFLLVLGLLLSFEAFIAINSIYISSLNGWKVDSPFEPDDIRKQAIAAMFTTIGFECVLFFALNSAQRRLRYVSIKGRAKIRGALQSQQEALYVRLKGVDNFAAKPENPTNPPTPQN